MRLAIQIAIIAHISCLGLLAELNFCNSSPLTIEAAVGYPAGGQWFTEGWFSLAPGDCGVVVAGNLTNRYYYAYAQTAGGRIHWNGELPMCTAGSAFRIPHAICTADSQRQDFSKIDTGGAASFDYSFSCPDCLDQSLVSAVRQYVPYPGQLADAQAPLSYPDR